MTTPARRVSFCEVRATLGALPDEVFRDWVDERIDLNGWPPSGPSWAGALRNRPLEYWRSLSWTRERIVLSVEDMTLGTRKIVNDMVDARLHVRDEYLPDSNARIDRVLRYVADNGVLPSLLVFLDDQGELEVVDGCHRLAAFSLCSEMVPPLEVQQEVDAWIGRPGQTSNKRINTTRTLLSY